MQITTIFHFVNWVPSLEYLATGYFYHHATNINFIDFYNQDSFQLLRSVMHYSKIIIEAALESRYFYFFFFLVLNFQKFSFHLIPHHHLYWYMYRPQFGPIIEESKYFLSSFIFTSFNWLLNALTCSSNVSSLCVA